MDKKNIIIVVIVVLVILATLAIILINKKGKSTNDSQTQTQTQTTNPIATKKDNGTFEIYNTDIKTNTGSTIVRATIKNISNAKTEKQKVNIVLIDKNGTEIGTITTTVPSLEVNKTTEIYAEDLMVYENIYDFKIK